MATVKRWVDARGIKSYDGLLEKAKEPRVVLGEAGSNAPHTYTPTASEEDFKAMLKKCGFGKLVRKKKKGLAQKSSRPFVTNLSLEILNALGIQQSRSVAEGGID